MTDSTLIEDLLAALRPIAAAYPDDPGTSDLYNDQPVTITLGDVRRAWAAIAKMERHAFRPFWTGDKCMTCNQEHSE